jgi:hypothetical protein
VSEFPPAPPRHARDCTVGNDALGCNCRTANPVSPGNGIGNPLPLYSDIERVLIGMVITSYPMDRTQYERGWNEALHAARKRLAALIEEART